MSVEHKASKQECTWQDVRKDVARVNPGLAQIIDQVDPPKSFKLWKVSYPFGANISVNGKFQLPDDKGVLKPSGDSSFSQSVRDSLGYADDFVPMGMLLDKKIEVYIHQINSVIPFFTMQPGRVFGLYGLFNKKIETTFVTSLWQLISGTRSITFLSKVSDANGHRRLKKEFNLKSGVPLGLHDQWALLKEIANSPGFNEPWQSQILLFTGKWFDKIITGEGPWQKLKSYLLESIWNETAYIRDKEVYDALFSNALAEKNLKPNPYLTDVVRHLLGIAMGKYPAYKVADDDLSGPISRFKQVFSDIYQLKFNPTVMAMSLLSDYDPLNPVYYSLELPSLIAYSPKSRKSSSKMHDLREIKHIQQSLTEYLLDEKNGSAHTPLCEVLKRLDFSYYHSDKDVFGEIESSQALVERDQVLLNQLKATPDRPFCVSSLFLRGCIRVSGN